MAEATEKPFHPINLDESLIFYPLGIRPHLSDLNVNQSKAQRIIEEVANAGSWTAPDAIDLGKFALEIWMLEHNYKDWLKIDSDAEAKRRYKRLINLHKNLECATRLYAVDGPWLDRELSFGWRSDFNFIKVLEENSIVTDHAGLHELLDAISLLASRIKVLADYQVEAGLDKASAYPLRHYTPTRILAFELERIGNTYLGLAAKFSRPSQGGKPDGLFIRFSMAVTQAIGVELEPETLAMAVQHNRKQKSRTRRTTPKNSP